jgi:hypothetical protein
VDVASFWRSAISQICPFSAFNVSEVSLLLVSVLAYQEDHTGILTGRFTQKRTEMTPPKKSAKKQLPKRVSKRRTRLCEWAQELGDHDCDGPSKSLKGTAAH